MHTIRSATVALLFIGFAPAGCGPSDASVEAAAAARTAEMDKQADRDLEETLSVLAEAEASMQPRTPAPALTYDAFRGKAIAPEADTTGQTAIAETD